ncbi:50S ribosomal protein L5 [bacterium]|nr:50S ribosomal protein L5 [bacterium]
MKILNSKERYKKEVVPKMMEEFDYVNKLAIPKLEKITLNIGLGKSLTNKEFTKIAEETLKRISGQKPILTKAKKSISNFKIREGMTIGIKVTLRGDKMYDFLDKLIHITFPRVRDFRGIDVSKKHIDRQGSFSYGFKEHTVFPEIRGDEVEHIHGLEMTITSTSKNRAETYFLLKYLGMPFIVEEKLEKKLKEDFNK